MENKAFFELLRSLSKLTSTQLERASEHIGYHLQHDLISQVLEEKNRERPECPHCHSSQVIHWGEYKGTLRYKCKDCSKTFSQLHATPLSRMRKREKWVTYAECLSKGMSLRKAAQVCGISLSTSFRWRHRFLEYAKTTKSSKLSGIIEADEVFVRESSKGKRQLKRPSRKRGGRGRGDVPLVPAVIALDRYGNQADKVMESNTFEQLNGALKPLLKSGSVLCTDGNTRYQAIVKETPGIAHKRLIGLDNQRVIDGVFHIQTLNSYVSRWRNWMFKFHGVGTDYLENYLAWFRIREFALDNSRDWIKGALAPINNT